MSNEELEMVYTRVDGDAHINRIFALFAITHPTRAQVARVLAEIIADVAGQIGYENVRGMAVDKADES